MTHKNLILEQQLEAIDMSFDTIHGVMRCNVQEWDKTIQRNHRCIVQCDSSTKTHDGMHECSCGVKWFNK